MTRRTFEKITTSEIAERAAKTVRLKAWAADLHCGHPALKPDDPTSSKVSSSLGRKFGKGLMIQWECRFWVERSVDGIWAMSDSRTGLPARPSDK